MQRALCAVLGVAAVMAATQAHTETIQWKQSINLPKGLNLPKDLKADILGIEPGDRYEELKPKLDALLKDSIADKVVCEPITESRTRIRYSIPGGFIEPASYIGQIEVNRELSGTSSRTIGDYLAIQLSAPASGHQVLGIKRNLTYRTPEDQPRISELMARLQEKYKAAPQDHSSGGYKFYRFQFDNGRAIKPPNASMVTCPPAHTIDDSQSVPHINPEGNCDVVLVIRIRAGLTQDHAETIELILSDNERTKANKTADFGFIEAAVREMQGKAKGVAPKL